VHKKERFFKIRAIVSAHGNTLLTRQNLQVHVEFLPEGMELVVRIALFVRIDVFKGFHLGSLGQKVLWCPVVEGFVVKRRWRVWCGFCYGHLEKKAKKR